MTQLKRILLCVATLAGLLNLQPAFACQPQPPIFLKSVSAEESRFPLVQPAKVYLQPCYYIASAWPFVFGSLTDEQVAQYVVSNINTTAAAWDVNKIYVAGDLVSYGGRNHMARWWTQGEAPGSSSEVWLEQADSNGNPPSWSATAAYAAGAKVSYGSSIYVAKWWTQGETPGTEAAAWAKAGSMAGRLPAPYSVTATYDPAAYGMMKISWTTSSFVPGTYALADGWKVKVNGQVVKQGADILTAVSDCPPNAPSCEARYLQIGNFVIPTGATGDQVTFWLCSGSTCRPTPRALWDAGSVFVPPPPPQ